MYSTRPSLPSTNRRDRGTLWPPSWLSQYLSAHTLASHRHSKVLPEITPLETERSVSSQSKIGTKRLCRTVTSRTTRASSSPASASTTANSRSRSVPMIPTWARAASLLDRRVASWELRRRECTVQWLTSTGVGDHSSLEMPTNTWLRHPVSTNLTAFSGTTSLPNCSLIMQTFLSSFVSKTKTLTRLLPSLVQDSTVITNYLQNGFFRL